MRFRLAAAPLAVVVAVAAAGIPTAGAQGAPPGGPSTTTSSTTTTSTTAPPPPPITSPTSPPPPTDPPPTDPQPTTPPPAAPATTAPATSASSTTSTTVPPTTSTTTPPGAGDIPPPPPPPPPPPTATPAELAQASALENQIANQSTVLDQLSDRYNKANLDALAASQRVVDAQANEAKAEAGVSSATDAITRANQTLHAAALDSYLDVKVVPTITDATTAAAAYELGIANVYSGAAVQTAAQRVRNLHQAEKHFRDVQQQISQATKAAQAQAAAAAAAEQKAQLAATQAAAQQARLMATLTNVQGDLASLIAIQKASLAVAAYSKISQGATLLFTPSGPLPPAPPQAAQAIAVATAQVGKQYVYGAAGPDTFDCSGLMQWSWAQVGVQLPRTAADQQAWATPIPISQVQPGDLVFFGNPAYHVGMYIGNGLMVEAPHTGATVDVTSLWWSDLAGFGRVHT